MIPELIINYLIFSMTFALVVVESILIANAFMYFCLVLMILYLGFKNKSIAVKDFASPMFWVTLLILFGIFLIFGMVLALYLLIPFFLDNEKFNAHAMKWWKRTKWEIDEAGKK